MARSVDHVRVGRQGRVVVPASLRKELDLRPGDGLIARAEDGRLIFEKKDAVLARIRKRFEHLPSDVDLAAELIEERREQARQDSNA